MTFEDSIYNGKVIGQSFTTDRAFFFFGNKLFQKNDFQKAFPEFTFLNIEQVHGDTIVKASETITQADAHWTDQTHTALLIKTADCMPILIHQGTRVAAVHAGWRGVQNKITEKTLRNVFSKDANLRLVCGPHIQKSSFEVDLDLAKQLEADFQNASRFYKVSDTNSNKAFVDLKVLLETQFSYPSESTFISQVDTKTTELYASYRREPEQNLRNYSFVARLK